MDNMSKSVELTEFQFHTLKQAAEGYGLIAVYDEAHTDEEKATLKGHMDAMEALAAAGLLNEVTESIATSITAHRKKYGYAYRAWSMTEDAVTMFRQQKSKYLN